MRAILFSPRLRSSLLVLGAVSCVGFHDLYFRDLFGPRRFFRCSSSPSSMYGSSSCGLMSSSSGISSPAALPVAAASSARPFDVLGFAELGARVLSCSELEQLKASIGGFGVPDPPPAPVARGGGVLRDGLGPIRKPRRDPCFDHNVGSGPVSGPVYGPVLASALSSGPIPTTGYLGSIIAPCLASSCIGELLSINCAATNSLGK